MQWTRESLDQAARLLEQFDSRDIASKAIPAMRAMGIDTTTSALRNAFDRAGMRSPTSYCRRAGRHHDADSTPIVEHEHVQPAAEDEATRYWVDKLRAATKRGPIPFDDLCNVLDSSPAKTRAVVEWAKSAGYTFDVSAGRVGWREAPVDDRIRDVGVAPVVGKRQQIAHISDTHLGSKYCLREQLKEFVHHAYDRGIREITHSGDVLDGMYKHGQWEVSHSGLEEQTQDLYETLPNLPGLSYHAITGNHDQTFSDAAGMDVGHYMTQYFRARGRNDLTFYGNRGAFLRLRGIVIHLWHPRSGVSYAKSYGIQKQVERYSSLKPSVLLTGHWHIYAAIYERGMHAIACPTFQAGGSAFGKSLGGAPAIGGLILSWDLTAHGTMRAFSVEKRSYFEQERPIEIHNDVDAYPFETLNV